MDSTRTTFSHILFILIIKTAKDSAMLLLRCLLDQLPQSCFSASFLVHQSPVTAGKKWTFSVALVSCAGNVLDTISTECCRITEMSCRSMIAMMTHNTYSSKNAKT